MGEKNRLQFRSIQFMITASFTLVTVLGMLFAGVVLYRKFAETAEQNARLNTEQIIEQVRFNLERYLNDMTAIYELVDAKIRHSDTIPDPRLDEQLGAILETRDDIVSLAVFTRDGELVTAVPTVNMRKNTRLKQQSWFQAALHDSHSVSFSLPHIQNLFKGQYKWVVSLSRKVTLHQGERQREGILLADVNFNTIDELCRRVSLGKRGYVYIIDLAGNIVYHPQQQLIHAGLKNENRSIPLQHSYGSYLDETDEGRRLVTVKTLERIGWKIVGVAYMDEMVTSKREISVFLFWLLILTIAFLVFVLTYLSAKIARPIQLLEKSMERMEQGDFAVNVTIRGSREAEQLARRFNLMVAKVRQLMDQIIREQEEKRKSELEVLQAQINPHFLYNTLNSVVRMVGSGRNEEVITTITALSKLFRISLSRGKSVITVAEELEHVKNYLIIQKMRYKNKFDYAIQAEEATLGCKTLKLILQPIVENAIYHGIERMADPGFIRVSVRAVEGDILFEVADNGLGMPAEVLAKIHSGEVKDKDGSGVGVKNVHERIRLFFGEEYGLNIESEVEAGTTVRIRIPMLRDEPQGGRSE